MERWDELIVQHSNVVKAAAKKYLVGVYSDWIDDAVQDVLIKAIIKRENYSSTKGSLSSWLHIMTRNYCFDLIDSRGVNKIFRGSDNELNCLSETPSLDIGEYQNRKIVRKALERISVRDRMILTLKYYFGYSGRDIANIMNMPEAGVAVIMQRAREKLKRATLQLGFDACC